MILFNFTTNNTGGGKFHAFKFLINIFNYIDKKEVVIALNKTMNLNIDGVKVYYLNSPSRSIYSRFKLLEIEKKYKINLVYTMAGPAYVNFRSFHIMGLSNAWLLSYNDRLLLEGYPSVLKKLKVLLKINYTRLHVNRANYYVFQTKTSKDNFIQNYHNINEINSRIIPNAIIDRIDIKTSSKETIGSAKKINVLIPSTYYPHKGIEDVLWVINNYKEKLDSFIFYFTLQEEDARKLLSPLNTQVLNLGGYTPFEEYSLLSKFEIILIPSKLETCSATMLEACMTEKYIIARDTDFSKEIFGENTNYFRNREELLFLLENYKCLSNSKDTHLVPIEYSKRTQLIAKMLKEFTNQS